MTEFEINPDEVVVPLEYPRSEPEPELRTSFGDLGQLMPIRLIKTSGEWHLFDGWKRLVLCKENQSLVKAVQV